MKLATIGLTVLALAFGAGPASADPWKDESGKGRERFKEEWKREKEWAKESRKREEEYHKELRKRDEEARKEARKAEERRWERDREGRGYEGRYRPYDAPRVQFSVPRRGYDPGRYGHDHYGHDHGGYGYSPGGYEGRGDEYVPPPPRHSRYADPSRDYLHAEPHGHYAEPHGAHYAPQPVPGGVETITIPFGSDKERYAEYRVPGRIVDVQLSQNSKAPCAGGSTWGYDGDRLWADAGCRGFFTVTYEPY